LAEQSTLKQTKGEFNLVGIVSGINHENAYREGITKQGKNKGKEWRSIRFAVATSRTNKIFVELTGWEQDEVTAYSSEKKETKKFPWSKRNKLPEGYAILQVRASLEKDEDDKKYVQKAMTAYDAVDYIREHLKDGDSVWVKGEISFQEFEGRNGQIVHKTVYTIKSIGKTRNPVDFDAEDFEETAGFVQNIIFDSAERDEETNKVIVNAYIVSFNGKASRGQFTVNAETNPKMAEAFLKKCHFGDTMELYGICRNELITKEEDIEDEGEEDPFNSEERPRGTIKVIRDYETELLIKGVTKGTWEQGVYTEDDFISMQAEEDYGSDKSSIDEDDDDPFTEDDDDLPF
jgi:single-stranded DNA-binding protein